MKATLNEDFDGMIEKAWKGLQKGSPQYEQLKDAFFGGVLCGFNRCTYAASLPDMMDGMGELEKISMEIHEHHKLAHSRATLWVDIQKAGER